MIPEILDEAVSDARTVKSLILTGELLRSLATSDQLDQTGLDANPLLARIVAGLPDVSAWRMHDHCASLTRLYAIFERYLRKAVRAWLSTLPSLCSTYSELGEAFRTIHRRGIARVLMDLDKDRFAHLGVESVLNEFVEAVSGKPVYSVLPEAFLSDTRILKRERIEELLTQVCLEDGWKWISKHRYITSFIEEIRGGQNTPDAELRAFVNYRNEAAHGSVDQVLGVVPLSEYADFVVAICRTIDELVRWNWVRYCREIGRVRAAGKVVERFRDNIVVAKVQKCTIAKSMEILLWGNAYCYSAPLCS